LPPESHDERSSRGWRLCPKCGSREDFREALREQVVATQLAQERHKAQVVQREEERRALISEMELNLYFFENKHITPDAVELDRGRTHVTFLSPLDDNYQVVVSVEERESR
jgi:hypothetical protein